MIQICCYNHLGVQLFINAHIIGMGCSTSSYGHDGEISKKFWLCHVNVRGARMKKNKITLQCVWWTLGMVYISYKINKSFTRTILFPYTSGCSFAKISMVSMPTLAGSIYNHPSVFIHQNYLWASYMKCNYLWRGLIFSSASCSKDSAGNESLLKTDTTFSFREATITGFVVCPLKSFCKLHTTCSHDPACPLGNHILWLCNLQFTVVMDNSEPYKISKNGIKHIKVVPNSCHIAHLSFRQKEKWFDSKR